MLLFLQCRMSPIKKMNIQGRGRYKGHIKFMEHLTLGIDPEILLPTRASEQGNVIWLVSMYIVYVYKKNCNLAN